jgi:Transposase IS116/IS110/IS902 family
VRDAADLADLLRIGRLPEAWIAPPRTRELRELVRYRAKLVAIRSGLKAQIHAVLAKAGVLIAVSDLFGVTGRKRLAKVPLGTAYAERIRSLLELIDILDCHEARFAAMIAERLDTHRGYQAVQQVPGIGATLAAVFVAEIGDVHGFTDPAHLCSWAGLTRATASPTPSCTADTSPNKAPKRSAGRRSRRCSATRQRPRSRPTNNASKLAAARTSPKSPRHANCSHWSTTGCATATSALSTVPGRREHSGRNRARPPCVMTPEPSAWSPP